MDRDPERLLNVRETAKRLGVHENTVRNWVKDGRLEDARVPGSRFHRFRVEDVERLANRAAASTPSLQTERRFLNPELVSASQLKQWPSNRQRDAQERFPELVRRLLTETPGISNISVRTGDGVALLGWDGLAESTGTAFLPAGHLAFELGVNLDPKAKASDDYANRVGPTPSDKTFVFVTLRRWAGASAWAEERRAEGNFADVRVLDGDDLEGWLQASPTAHHWISEHLGLRPRQARTIDGWWAGISESTDPALPLALFLAGRATQADQLKQRLSGPPQLTAIQSESDQDVLGFIHAALQRQSDQTPSDLSPALIVDSADVWDRVVEQPGQAVLIPHFEGASIGTAINRGHHVIAVVDRTAASRRAADLVLPRLDRLAASEAFQAAGVPFNKADRLAVLGRRSLPALARRLSRNPSFERPVWASEPDATTLAPLVILGSWTINPEDTAVIEHVTGLAWHEVERTIRRVSTSNDPVLRKVGEQWNFTSPEEAFLLLRDSLTSTALGRLAEQVEAVLLAPDAMRELGRDERLLAQMRGTRRRYSAALRRGLAQGLALMGAIGAETLIDGGHSLAEVAARAVERLLASANQDPSSDTWHELAEVLPLLAEGAPDAFLEAVEDDLTSASPVLVKLFQERDIFVGFGPSSGHPHLLWAIETVCWSPVYLIPGVQVLTRLAALDPGGKTANRPRASLARILCGWVRNTSAPLEVRLQAVDAVHRVSDAVGWQLILDLWPTYHGSVMPPAGPHLRDDWRPTATSIPLSDWVAMVQRLVDRAIVLAANSAVRLSELVEKLATVPANDRDRLIDFLEEQAATDLGTDGRLQVWAKLRAETARHERYAGTEWAMSPATIERLKAVTARFEPDTDPQRFSFLFDWHPDLPGVDVEDHDRYDAEVKRRQDDALRAILGREDTTQQLERLAHRVAVPHHLGWALASHDQITLTHMIPWLASSDPALEAAATSWAHKSMLDHGAIWLASALADEQVSGDARTLLLKAIPARGEFWSTIQGSPVHEDEATYWTTAAIEIVEVDDADVALDSLVVHGRYWSAIAVASNALDRSRQQATDLRSALKPGRVVQLLDDALQQTPDAGELTSMTSHYVGQLLDFLTSGSAADQDVARLEYRFFRLLEHTREPAVLNRVLATDPETFVALVCLVYRGKNEPRREQNEAAENATTQALWVLRGWKGFPGRNDDGTLNSAVLESWVKQARLQLSDADRGDVGDEVIGEAMAYTPTGSDGVWPAEPVRDLIDIIGSRELESGLVIGRQNTRGFTSRGAFDGGDQERVLASQYRGWSDTVRAQWPRTARVLKAIAESYERDARYHDVRAELDADSE